MKTGAIQNRSVVTVSIIVNLLLFTVKYCIGLKNLSLAIEAGAWHTLSDSISSVIVMSGLWIAGRPGNVKHSLWIQPGLKRFSVLLLPRCSV